jgi:2-polyprenyl-3-methyl-5-hydroxy-6-metoxy-1,4-benzoquinol methylase
MVTAADWYDVALTEGDAKAMLPLEESPWLKMYQAAASLIPATDQPIIDLGCGTGRFARLLVDEGFLNVSGMDFAAKAIEEAELYVPEAVFSVTDLREFTVNDEIEGGTVFTCLEVLEHLEDDLDLISRIPAGLRLIFSVPNYWSESHLRRFITPRDVFDRYGGLLEFDAWQMVPMTTSHAIHVFRSRRRPDCL